MKVKSRLTDTRRVSFKHIGPGRKLIVGTAIQPVILYFASAKKCCEELLVDVAEEKGELADGEAQQTAESTQKNDEAKQQQQNKKKKKKKKKGKGKK